MFTERTTADAVDDHRKEKPLHTYHFIYCGHLVRVDLEPIEDECAYCADYADAYAQDALDELFEDAPSRVVPHTRE